MFEKLLTMDRWIILGLLAQFLFFMRFFIKWIATERRKKSVIPVSFWYLSIIGASGLLSYAIHINDPVFILGQSMGLLIYVRNLMYIHRREPLS